MRGKLTGAFLKAVKTAGKYPDGGNLYYQVEEGGRSKCALFRYDRFGRDTWLGLNAPWPEVPLSEARDLALALNRLRREGKDPLTEKRAAKAAARQAKTFREIAIEHIEAQRAGWSSTYTAEWTTFLEAYAYPIIGDLPPDAIDGAAVLRCIKPQWETKTETMSRVRAKIEVVLNHATASGYRADTPNPARWKGGLQSLLAKKAKIAPIVHRKAMAYAEVPLFLAGLRRSNGAAVRALEFAILCASRSGEVLGATWDEINLSARTWTIPAARMKARRDHVVPLSDRAIEIIEEMKAIGLSERFVFTGRRDKPLNKGALLIEVRKIDADVDAHGFRTSFRIWASEKTNAATEVLEQALAHTIGSATQGAYDRSDRLAKRRKVMDAWSRFCGEESGEVARLVA